MRTRLMAAIAFLFSFATGFSQQKDDPKAYPDAIYTFGKARFTVLTAEMIRMEWSANGQFNDEASQVFINRKLPVVNFTVTGADTRGFKSIAIRTSKLTLHYIADNDSFNAANLYIELNTPEGRLTWEPGMKDTLNLKGTTRTLDNWNGGKPEDLENGLISRSGWALIDDSKSLLFDGNKEWNWVKERTNKGTYQDWYFFGYGKNYRKALNDYTKVAGKIPLPPRYAFGYWWSRYWIYSDQEMKELASTFKEFDIPIDIMIIDMDWHETYDFRGNALRDDGQGSFLGWTGYTWNRNLFPKPEKLLDWMEKNHIKNALNIHPASGVPPMEEKYGAFAKAYGFDTTGKKYIPYYMSDKKWAKTYFDTLLRPMEKMGVDFWWLDWQQYPYDRLKPGLSNTWWANYTFFTDMQKQGKRPLLFHRWGGMGNHRYQIGFSGDTFADWPMLQFQPYFTSTAANVGYSYWSHDIGGHQIGLPKDNELLTRWMQFGIFSPILRTHSGKKAIIDRRIWTKNELFLPLRNIIRMRYEFSPYIYTAARETYDNAISLCSPLYYDYPEKAEAYTFTNQYMFGKDMMVAPMNQKMDSSLQLSTSRIWIPEGEWTEFMTGAQLSGNATYTRSFSISEIPFYVKNGSIIPGYPATIKNLQQPMDTLVLTVMPGSTGSGELYEDDGESEAYKENGFARTKFTKSTLPNGDVQITIQPRKGSYKNMRPAKAYEIRMYRDYAPLKVTVNGKAYAYNEDPKAGSWTYSGRDLQTRIHISSANCNSTLQIILTPDPANTGKEKLLEEGMTLFNRMPKVIEMLKYEISNVDWGAAIPDAILKIEQTPTRIQYNPQKAAQELMEMKKNLPAMLQALRNIADVDKAAMERIIKHLPEMK
jgi:alpha-glucosidase (family GH31 glycosyl hydrolase)